MKLDLTLVVGIIIVGNLSLDTGLTVTSFTSTFDTVNPMNKGSSRQEHPGTNNILELKPNKNSYRPGEPVIIAVKNNGVEPLTFPDAAMGLLIENVETKESFGLIAAQVLTSLQPGQSKSMKWDQRSHDGIPASEGEYKALVTTIPDLNLPSLLAYSHFQIKESK